jgi:hypothetical protein
MSDPGQPLSVDPETLAALLDGRLAGDERARVLAAIDASPELLAIVGDAAEARALALPADKPLDEIADRPTDVSPAAPSNVAPRPRPEAPPPSLALRRSPRWFLPAMAAAVVIVIAVPLLDQYARRGTSRSGTRGIVESLARPSATSAELPGDAWGTMRGATDGASSTGRAVRIGARLADAHLLVATRDTALRGVTTQIAALLDSIPGAAVDAPLFRQISATDPGSVASRLRDASREIEGVLQPAPLHAGAWLESARIASARSDTSFFSASTSKASRNAVLSASEGTNRALADSLVAGVASRPIDMPAIGALATRLLGALAR